jgi:hypothetical protein
MITVSMSKKIEKIKSYCTKTYILRYFILPKKRLIFVLHLNILMQATFIFQIERKTLETFLNLISKEVCIKNCLKKLFEFTFTLLFTSINGCGLVLQIYMRVVFVPIKT